MDTIKFKIVPLISIINLISILCNPSKEDKKMLAIDITKNETKEYGSNSYAYLKKFSGITLGRKYSARK
jgi:hypothetical protein